MADQRKRTPAERRLEESRARLASHIAVLRDSVERETGWRPNLRTWGGPIAAFTVGLALAGALGRRRPAALGDGGRSRKSGR